MRGCSVGTAKERRQGSVSTEPVGKDASCDAGTASSAGEPRTVLVFCVSGSPLAKSWLRYKGPVGCHSLICSTNIYQVFSIFWLLFR